MMGYEGRRALLDDTDEWVNIPFVVREFMKQLNDEAQASRAMLETLRQEQRESNLLLRRVMQKQADLDIDNTRNIMSLSHQASRAALNSTEKRQAEQIHFLCKRAERLEDKVQHISAQVEELSQAAVSSASADGAFGELKGLVATLTAKAETTERLLKDHMDAYTVVRKSTESLVNATALGAVTDLQKALKDQLDIYMAQQSGLEKSVWLLEEASTSQQEESSRLRGICGELSEIVEADRKESTDRLTSCFNTVEKLEKLYVAQHSELEGRLKRTEEAFVEYDSRSREEAKFLYAELRGLVKVDRDETQKRCYELAEELRAVTEQQRRLTEQLAATNLEAEAATQRAVRQVKDISARLASLGAEVEQLSSTFVARRDHQKEQRQTQDSLDAVRSSVADTVASFQAQMQQLAASLKTMRAEQGEDNDWLHSELGRIGTIVGYASQQRERQERQVTSLCEIVHNLSVAVERLQKGSGSAAASSPVPAVSPAQANPPESDTKTEVPAAWETWRLTLVKDVEERIAAAVPQNAQPHASPPVLERVSQQLNELTAKVDGGAKYTQAIIAQQIDQMRHTIKDEVTHQLQSHPAMREVTPALVEVEAVKRRVAGVELSLQTLSTSAEQWHTDSEAGSFSASAVMQRVLLVEEAVEDFRRRLLELGEHVIGVDQRSSELARSAYGMEAQLQDQQRMALKLGTDLTAALESLLHTEQSLSRHQDTTALQLSEVHMWLEKWKCHAATAPTATAPSVEPLSGAQNGAASSGASTDGSRMGLSASVAQLTETVERLYAQVTHMEVETLQAVRTDLEAIRSECAAAVAATEDKIKKDDVRPPASNALDMEEVHAAYDELRRRLDVEGSLRREAEEVFRAVEARLIIVETCVSEMLPTSIKVSSPACDADSATAAAAVTNCAVELARCHERLDVIQQQLTSSACRCCSNGECAGEMKREAHHQDVHLQQQLGRLQEDLHTFVMSQLRTEMREAEPALVEAAAAAAALRCEDTLRASADSAATAVDAQAYTEGLKSLQATVEEIQHSLEEWISSVLEGRRCVQGMEQELRTTVEGLHALDKAQSELRSDLEGALSVHEVHQRDLSLQLEAVMRSTEININELRAKVKESAVVSTGEPCEAGVRIEKPSGDEKAAWAMEVINSMDATYYTRTLLEERLENIWSSMISLLTRKEDVSAVHDKLNGLHQLIQEEMQIELQRLEEQMANQLAEKVSLANLQDILERHIVGSDADFDSAVV